MTNFSSFRPISLTLILFLSINQISTFAQTSGPISPEAASFEPFDMTDIVNLPTGDFVYNIPLFEVPGPGGGFPISLSYHAGIMPTEDASWVGLGWSLNPGAINRTVNGYADDYFNAKGTTRQFWSGGTTTTKSYSVNVQFPGIVGANVNLTVSRDTYKGTGYGFGGGVSLGYNDGRVRLGVNAQVGTSPYGGSAYMSVGASAGVGIGNMASANVGVGYSTANGLSAGVGLSSAFTSVGVNISSSGLNSSFSVMGNSGSRNVSNRNYGNISTETESSGFTASLVVVSVSFKKETTRYWINAIDELSINGVLHLESSPIGMISSSYFDDHDYDVYTALELGHKESFELTPEPDATFGGTYPDYDTYQVVGQGIVGNMRPYIYQAHLNKRNDFNNTNDGREDYVKQVAIGYNNNDRTHFRFINDFSNDMLNEQNDWTLETKNDNLYPDYEFDELDERFGFRDYELSGTRHIEHYTNKEITDGIEGFLEANATGFDRSELDQINQIGAFAVTNESGVTYHYSLPAYTRDEYLFSKKRDESKGLHYNHYEKREPYAYVWHLTAMTGPDYVDRGSPGLDREDWGYWVEFEYGKWTEHFAWRNPGLGFNTDMDQEFDSYSEGQKEVYYLDAIRTKSHTAYFVKDLREDAKSNTYIIKHRTNRGMPRLHQNKYHEGSFEEIVPEKEPYCEGEKTDGAIVTGTLKQYKAYPTKSLKLTKIILVENNLGKIPEPIDKSNGIEYKLYNGAYWDKDPDESIIGCDFSPLRINYHLYQNVLDEYDLARMEDDGLMQKSIKSIEFVTDYSLAPGTPNSSSGKLTLKALESYGIEGTSYMPPTLFDYDNLIPLPVNSHAYPSSSGPSSAVVFKTDLSDYDQSKVEAFVSQIQKGDIFRFRKGSKTHYAYIFEIGDDYFRSKLIGDQSYEAVTKPTQMYITKNPPFNQHAVDQWGHYKSDFDFSKIGGNETLTKRPSSISANGKDVWSLRRIKSNLGSEIEIEYESDEYEEVAMATSAQVPVSSIGITFPDVTTLKLNLLNEGSDLGSLFNVGDKIDLSFTLRYKIYNQSGLTPFNSLRVDCDCEDGFTSLRLLELEAKAKFIYKTYSSDDLVISSIDEGSYQITVSAPELVSSIGSDEYEVSWNNANVCSDDISCTYRKSDDGFYVVGGVVTAPFKTTKGGGIRTKSITISSENYSNTTYYDYSGGLTSFEPFGIVKPHFFEEFQEFVDDAEDTTHINTASRALKRGVMDGYHEMFLNSRDIIPPSVMYKTVTVSEEVKYGDGENFSVPGATEYEFETFSRDLVGYQTKDKTSIANLFADEEDHQKVLMAKSYFKDYTSRVGALKRITHFGPNPENPQESLIKLDESIYHYLHDGIIGFDANVEDYENLLERYNNIGVTKELFTNVRIAKVGIIYKNIYWGLKIPYAKNYLFAVLGSKESFPSVKIGETHYNYKTGLSTKSYIKKYDHYTGIPVETITSDSYGNYYLEETDLAYHKYAEMGPIVENKSINKNMLTQVAGAKTWRINPPSDFENLPNEVVSKQGLLSAEVQTWDNTINTLSVTDDLENRWRKKANYTWIGDNRELTNDGLYPPSGFTEFNYNNESNNSNWEKASEITLYDYYSHPLEAKDINNSFAATKMDSDQLRVLSTATNASYEEFIFSGGEDRKIFHSLNGNVHEFKLGGNLLLQQASIVFGQPEFTHTGQKSISIRRDKTGIKYEWTPKKNYAHSYKINLWIHKDSPDKIILQYDNVAANGSSQIEVHELSKDEAKRSGDWYQVECIISANNLQKRSITLTHDPDASQTTTTFDDFRMQPIGSSMTCYVYDKFGRLSDMLDNNNLFTHYEYNEVGQLIEVTKETFQFGSVKTQEIEYNYVEK